MTVVDTVTEADTVIAEVTKIAVVETIDLATDRGLLGVREALVRIGSESLVSLHHSIYCL